jgi:cellulose synthase/poly-beta-1,6-N-acetylglucosamine synthase-like glycosyltransferase
VASVAVIIPAFNEGARVAAVVRPCLQAKLASRVLVVDDGSADDTTAQARTAGADTLTLSKNVGKAGAMDLGVKHVHESAVCFLDGDLVGLTPQHVDDLIRPYLAGATMVVGALTSGDAGISQAAILVLSGQRVLSKASWQMACLAVPSMITSRFGVEVALTIVANRFDWTVATVRLPGLGHVQKESKWGSDPGFAARLKMWFNVYRTASKISGKALGQDLLYHLGRGAGYSHRIR